jgi:hypothetical protein
MELGYIYVLGAVSEDDVLGLNLRTIKPTAIGPTSVQSTIAHISIRKSSVEVCIRISGFFKVKVPDVRDSEAIKNPISPDPLDVFSTGGETLFSWWGVSGGEAMSRSLDLLNFLLASFLKKYSE